MPRFWEMFQNSLVNEASGIGTYPRICCDPCFVIVVWLFRNFDYGNNFVRVISTCSTLNKIWMDLPTDFEGRRKVRYLIDSSCRMDIGAQRWRKISQRLPEMSSTSSRHLVDGNIRPDFPNVFTAFRQSSLSPPFCSPSNPSLPLFLRVHRLCAHTELEVLELVTTFGHLAIPVKRLYLTRYNLQILFR